MEARNARPTAFGKSPPRVLVVDDDPALGRMVRRALEIIGCVVVTVASGREARACCEASPLWELVLLDLTLPDETGESLVVAIRDLLDATRPVLIVMTGRDVQVHELPPGVAEVLHKPFSIRALLNTVKRAIIDRRRASPTTA